MAPDGSDDLAGGVRQRKRGEKKMEEEERRGRRKKAITEHLLHTGAQSWVLSHILEEILLIWLLTWGILGAQPCASHEA